MAVATVKIVSIIGMMSQLNSVINICGKSQVFHPDNALSFYSNTGEFTPLSEKNPYSASLQVLKDLSSSVEMPLEIVDISDFNATDNEIHEYVDYLSKEFNNLLSKRTRINKDIENVAKTISQMKHFVGLDLNLSEISKCEYIKFRFGRLPKENLAKIDAQKDNDFMIFFPCTEEGDYYWGVYSAPVEELKEIDRVFASLYFERLDISDLEYSPEEYIKILQKRIDDKKNELENLTKQIHILAQSEAERCSRFYSRLEELNTYFGIRKYAAKYNNSFILVGWVPEENEEEFSSMLDKVDGIEYSFDAPEKDAKHSPPIKLKNRKIFKPFEQLIDMYGLPSYTEIDPTPFVAVTFVILFGIMFADLGQGLVLSLFGYLMWKFKKFKMGQILVPCGISSALFGTFFGSVFGFEHVLDGFYQNVFHLQSKPIEIMESTNEIIYSAVGIGLVLLLVAMIINIYSSFKQHNFERAIFGANGIAGFILYSSIVFGAIGQMIMGIKLFTPAYIICFIIIPVISIFLQEPLGKLVEKNPKWKPESWGDYITQSSFELFEVALSYVTNTLSFLRVGAFVLIHASMMLAVFTIGEMVGGSGTVGYVITVILGNIFVMCLEAFLTTIQVIRLEFYEMFIRFFDGSGNAFTPVRVEK